ncbi:MAG: hypothetical protein IRZ28_17650 [Steroidobacteraceae bacterium]|nr:hypothetical protein [Steroidobacteraceae bacterium]
MRTPHLRTALILCISFLLITQAVGQDQVALQPQEVTRFDGSSIHYYIAREDSRVPQPIVLFIHGSDCNSIANHPRIRQFEAVMPGAAVVYVEKYGITTSLRWSDADDRTDCPQGYLANNSPQQRVLDNLQVIAQIRKSGAAWWNHKLVVVGGSEGAGIAEQVAALTPETQRLIIFGFGARRFEDDVLQSVRSGIQAKGLSYGAQEQQIGELRSKLAEASESRDASEFLFGYSYAWWASMLAFDQLEALSSVDVPVLALQGARDENVSVAGARMLVNEARRRGCRIEYLEYAGLDHGFADRDGHSHLHKVIADIAVWLKQPESLR